MKQLCCFVVFVVTLTGCRARPPIPTVTIAHLVGDDDEIAGIQSALSMLPSESLLLKVVHRRMPAPVTAENVEAVIDRFTQVDGFHVFICGKLGGADLSKIRSFGAERDLVLSLDEVIHPLSYLFVVTEEDGSLLKSARESYEKIHARQPKPGFDRAFRSIMLFHSAAQKTMTTDAGRLRAALTDLVKGTTNVKP
jgi:hypothetical protein